MNCKKRSERYAFYKRGKVLCLIEDLLRFLHIFYIKPYLVI